MISRTERYCTTKAQRAKSRFKGASHKEHELQDSSQRCGTGGAGLRRGRVLLAAFAWGDSATPEVVSAEPPGFREAPPAEKPASVAAEKSPLSAGSNKVTSLMDTGVPLRAGEVLEYTANVSKLNDVATLRLQVAGRGNFLGKSTWHLQAFAHTQESVSNGFRA